MDKIPWIGKLTSLEELDNFNVREECGYKIGQLKNLQNLRKLRIGGLENVRSSEEAADANLIEKNILDKLSLVWPIYRSTGIEVDEPLLDNLRPHPNLKELNIKGYAGVRSPYWMTATSLSISNITSIALSNCWRWEDLPPFGQLPWLKFLHLVNMRAVRKLCCPTSVGGCAFPSLLELELNYMPDLELLEGEHMFPLLNKLIISCCPSLKGLPALPLTLNELEIEVAGLTSLPMMQQDCSSSKGRASCSSSSHPALAKLKIRMCPNLTSLDGFMLQQQYFPALEDLSIVKCENLTHFLNLSLLESLPILTSLDSLEIDGCASVASLPPALVFPRLSSLHIDDCKELSSLAGLQALPLLELLFIGGCDKLIELSLLQPPLLDLTSTSHTDMVLRRPSIMLIIDRQSLLRLELLRNLNSVSKLTIYDGTELASLDEQWLLQNRNSLESLRIEMASSLESLPPSMINLRSLRELEIDDAPLLQSIPDLPTSMKFLSIRGCRLELKEYIEGSGKFSNVEVKFSNIHRVEVEEEEEEQSEDEEEQWEDAEEQ